MVSVAWPLMCFLWLDNDNNGHIIDIEVTKVQLFMHSQKVGSSKQSSFPGYCSNYCIKRNDILVEK